MKAIFFLTFLFSCFLFQTTYAVQSTDLLFDQQDYFHHQVAPIDNFKENSSHYIFPNFSNFTSLTNVFPPKVKKKEKKEKKEKYSSSQLFLFTILLRFAFTFFFTLAIVVFSRGSKIIGILSFIIGIIAIINSNKFWKRFLIKKQMES